MNQPPQYPQQPYQQPQQPYQQPGYPPPQPPPQKSGMGAGKVILIVLAVILVLSLGSCLVCTAIVGGAANEVAEQAEKEIKKAEKELEGCEDEDTVPWEKYAADLKENEARVAKKWKGKCQKVSGVVSKIDSGFNDEPIVIIKGDNAGFDLNTLRCEPKSEKKAMKLSKGDKITVWGLGGNEILGSLELNHCAW